jgi:transcriptional regulator GlxA family with amidase domain
MKTDHLPTSHPIIRRCIKVVTSEIYQDHTLQTLSERVGASKTTLNRVFKSELNTTPIDWLWRLRIELSCRPLLTTNLNIQMIALSLGFKSQTHFGRLFKSYLCVTPSEYRRQNIQQSKELASTGNFSNNSFRTLGDDYELFYACASDHNDY